MLLLKKKIEAKSKKSDLTVCVNPETINAVTLKHIKPSHTFCVCFRRTSNGKHLCNEDLSTYGVSKALHNNNCNTISINYVIAYITSLEHMMCNNFVHLSLKNTNNLSAYEHISSE